VNEDSAINPAIIIVILNGVKDLATAGKGEILRIAQNDSIDLFSCLVNKRADAAFERI
jgi:hypothetical protein